MKIVVIIQARMGSTRLPGKVMMKLEDKPVLAHVIERCLNIPLVNEVIVATTNKIEDDLIARFAEQADIFCYRGSEANVLLRYYEAAKIRSADVIVRVTSDCPLLDPEVSNQVIAKYLEESDTDYCSNTLIRKYPQGLDVEVFSFAALEQAFLHGIKQYEQEHVTPYIYQHDELFKLTAYISEEDHSNLRWTLDTPEDWELIEAIYKGLYISGRIFAWKDALQMIEDNPYLQKINDQIIQKKLAD